MKPPYAVIAALAVGLLVYACGSSNQVRHPFPAGGEGGETTAAGAPNAGGAPASGAAPVAGDATGALGGAAGEAGAAGASGAPCATPAGPGTIHGARTREEIMGNVTWQAADSPHILMSDVLVRDGAHLEIEPCVVVQLAAGVAISVAAPLTPNTGSLSAIGTASQPIRFEGLDGARWNDVYVVAPGTARFAYTSFQDGGADNFEGFPTLDIVGDSALPVDPSLFVDHVSISGSAGYGIVLRSGATFEDGSQALTVSGSGSGTDPRKGSYPLRISEHVIPSLPSGTYSGNLVDEIELVQEGDGTAGHGLVVDATLPDLGVPYHLTNGLDIGGGDKLTTLTIEAGVTLKFAAGQWLDVQRFSNDLPATAALIAVGTAKKPIVFSSAAAKPAPDDWGGLYFNGILSDTDRLDHVLIEYAGNDCSCILLSCSQTIIDGGTWDAAIVLDGQAPGAFITNTTFRNIDGNAILEGYDGVHVDMKPTNTFSGIAGCNETYPAAQACPQPNPTCD